MSRTYKRRCAVAAMALIAMTVQTPVSGSSNAAQLTGKVTSQVTGQGLADIYVLIHDASTPFNGLSGISETQTDANGNFTVTTNLNAVKLLFEDRTDQFVDTWYGGVYYKSSSSSDLRPWIEAAPIASTANTDDLNIALERAAAIDVLVRDEGTQQPLRGVVVAVYDQSMIAGIGHSAPDGHVTIMGLRAQPQRLMVRSPVVNEVTPMGELGFQRPYLDEWHPDAVHYETAQPITTSVSTTRSVTVDLRLGAVVTGTASYEGFPPDVNAGSGSATISVGNACMPLRGGQIGLRYVIRGVAPGPSRAAFSPANMLQFQGQFYDGKSARNDATVFTPTLGVTTTDINVRFPLANRLVIRLQDPNGVALDSSALNNVSAFAFDAQTGTYRQIGLQHYDGALHNDSPLLDGTYLVAVASDGVLPPTIYDGATRFESASRIELSGGTTREITVTVPSSNPTGHIKGRVTAADSGAPLANVYVRILSENVLWFQGLVSTDETGHYTSTRLFPGRYTVHFRPTSDPTNPRLSLYAAEWAGDVASFDSTLPISVTADTTVTVDAALDLGATLTGTVVATDTNTPLSFVRVRLFDQNGHEVPLQFPIATGMSGQFNSLPTMIKPGVYRIQTDDLILYRYPDCSVLKTYRQAFYPGVATFAQAAPVTLTAGGTVALNLELSTAAPLQPPAPTPTITPMQTRTLVHLPVLHR
jgi:hypothetical protein